MRLQPTLRLKRLLAEFRNAIFKPRANRDERSRPEAVAKLFGVGLDGQQEQTIRAGWLIDGSGDKPRRAVQIAVRSGIVHSITSANRSTGGGGNPPKGQFFDFSGCTILPGLIDSHVHLAMTGSVDEGLRTRLRGASVEVVQRMVLENLQAHLRNGVVAVRDGGDAWGNVLQFSQGRRGCSAQPVRVFAAGRAWYRKGRYGRFIGRTPFSGCSLAESIRRDGEGGDQVKIIQSGLNSLIEYGKQTAPQFDLEEMSAAVQAAAQVGRTAMVHANGEAPVRIAVIGGCRSVEHGFFMGTDNLERMVENGVVWVPTVVTMRAYVEHYARIGRNPSVARRTLDHQLEQLFMARRLGLTVALGTDSGSPGVDHGAAMIAEMKLFMQAGFSLEETVRCASVCGAQLVGAESGLLAPAKPATFIIVEGEPSGLPENLRTVKAVFIAGIEQVVGG